MPSETADHTIQAVRGPAKLDFVRDPSFLLMYAPQHFIPEDSAKPDGALGPLYLAGTLRANGYSVGILDACVGNEKYELEQTFYRTQPLPSGLVRIGLTLPEIGHEIEPWDVIGLTSIFTAQTSRVLEVVEFIKRTYPPKLVILGGVNARHQLNKFLDAGADLVCLSEAESTILKIGDVLRRGSRDFSGIPGIAYRHEGRVVSNPMTVIEDTLDRLALPAWDLLPLERYWKIARPHGGGFKPEAEIRYGSMMTSRGCPFRCTFCHISKEGKDSPSGNIRSLRLKSRERVLKEFDVLKDLGIQYIFLEDDSLLAKKERAMDIFQEFTKRRLTLSDVNGVNILHLCTRQGNRLVADERLMETMAEAGFTELSLPFESGSPRIVQKYASSKWSPEITDEISIVRTAKRLGLTVGGNYIFGYPDETYDELTETIMLAKRHMDAGMDRANLMVVVPYPGTMLHDYAVAHGHLSPDFDPDRLNWLYPTMENTLIHPDVLKYVNRICWRLLNTSTRIEAVTSMYLRGT